MSILELNDIFLGNNPIQVVNQDNCILKDNYDLIKDLLLETNGLYTEINTKYTKSYTEFFECNPLLDAYFQDRFGNNKEIKKDFFYSQLCGAYIPYIPCELLALFILAKNSCETPNKMISLLDKLALNKYITKPLFTDIKIFKKLIDTLYGYDVKLVTKYNPIVVNNGIAEIYVSNIDNICLCKEEHVSIFNSADDKSSINYNKEKGVVIGEQEVPIRVLINHLGITFDDLDLRKVDSLELLCI